MFNENHATLRQDFPVTNEVTYLASASVTPSPIPVTQAGVDFVRSKGSVPYDLDDMLAKCDYLRGQFATLINATTPEVGLIYTTSEAENMIVNAIGLQAGDNIVTDDLHYSASYVIYEQLSRQGIEIRIAKREGLAPSFSTFEQLVDHKTKLLSVAWVSHQTGYRHHLKPLGDLVHAHGGYFYADVIQGAGMLPLDVQENGLDFCAAGSYKWMLGSFGAALFYVRGSLMPMITPDRFGFFHVLEKQGLLSYKLPEDGRKFMYATPAFGPVYQLSAGIDYVLKLGVENIAEYVISLAYYLRENVQGLGFELLTPEGNQSAIVAFKHGFEPSVIKKALEQEDVHVNFRENDSQIRIGSALFNNQEDINHFLSVLQALKR